MVNLIQQITWVRIEENGLLSLNYIDKLENLQFLFLYPNRVSDYWDIKRLSIIPKLMKLWLTSNQINKKPIYR